MCRLTGRFQKLLEALTAEEKLLPSSEQTGIWPRQAEKQGLGLEI
jgi:hypothetical protein